MGGHLWYNKVEELEKQRKEISYAYFDMYPQYWTPSIGGIAI